MQLDTQGVSAAMHPAQTHYMQNAMGCKLQQGAQTKADMPQSTQGTMQQQGAQAVRLCRGLPPAHTAEPATAAPAPLPGGATAAWQLLSCCPPSCNTGRGCKVPARRGCSGRCPVQCAGHLRAHSPQQSQRLTPVALCRRLGKEQDSTICMHGGSRALSIRGCWADRARCAACLRIWRCTSSRGVLLVRPGDALPSRGGVRSPPPVLSSVPCMSLTVDQASKRPSIASPLTPEAPATS